MCTEQYVDWRDYLHSQNPSVAIMFLSLPFSAVLLLLHNFCLSSEFQSTSQETFFICVILFFPSKWPWCKKVKKPLTICGSSLQTWWTWSSMHQMHPALHQTLTQLLSHTHIPSLLPVLDSHLLKQKGNSTAGIISSVHILMTLPNFEVLTLRNPSLHHHQWYKCHDPCQQVSLYLSRLASVQTFIVFFVVLGPKSLYRPWLSASLLDLKCLNLRI